MSKAEVWLIRHAESTANCGSYGNQPEDISLTATGQQQAQELSKLISKEPELIIVSPFKRTLETAQPLIKRWPNASLVVWAIQELVYLSPARFVAATPEEQRKMIANYWQRLDPFFCDGQGAESFANFIDRLIDFQLRLATNRHFALVIGHGQFFKAYLLGLQRPWAATKEWMEYFRNEETFKPLLNCEIIKLKVLIDIADE